MSEQPPMDEAVIHLMGLLVSRSAAKVQAALNGMPATVAVTALGLATAREFLKVEDRTERARMFAPWLDLLREQVEEGS